MINRRSLITGLISLVAAPAIVRATSIMQVRQMIEPIFDGEDITFEAVSGPLNSIYIGSARMFIGHEGNWLDIGTLRSLTFTPSEGVLRG